MKSSDKALMEQAISDNIMIRSTESGLPFQHIGHKMLDFFGYSSEEELSCALEGKLANCIHPEDLQFITQRVNLQLSTAKEYTVEYRIRQKSGSYIWVQDRGRAVEAADGGMRVLYSYCALSARSAMGMSDESKLYGDIVHQSTHGVYVVAQQSHKLLYANSAMEAIFAEAGIQDYLGQKCYCALRHRSQPCKECLACPMTNPGEPHEVYLDFLGKYYSVASHAIEWRGASACVIYLVDISEGKKARFELAQTKRKLTAAIDHAGLVYWEYDIAGQRAYLNSIATTEYGLDEVIEGYPASLYESGAIHPDSVTLYSSMVQAVQAGEPMARGDIKTVNAKGDLVWKRIRFTTLFDEAKQPFWAVATAENIDEYKALENRFTTVLEQNHIDTWMYDMPRRTIIQNHNTEGIYGIHDKEISNVPESLIEKKQCYAEDMERFLEFYRRLHQGETQVSATVRLWDVRTQSYVWKRCTYTALPNRNGHPIYALGSAVDVTDQMEVKHKYEEAIKYRYRTLGENVILAGHCNVTRNRILEVDDKTGLDMEHRFGMQRDEYFNGIASLIPDQEQRQTFCQIFGNENTENSFKLGITQHDYSCTISLDGGRDICWISTHVDVALQPDTNEIIGFLTVTDVSASKMQQQVLDAVIQCDYDFVAHLNLHSNTVVFYNSKNQRAQFKDYQYGVSYCYTDAIRHAAERYIVDADRALYEERMALKNVAKQLQNMDSYEFTYHLRERSGEIRTKQTRFVVHDWASGIVVFSRADVTNMLVQQEKQKIALSESLALAQQANSSKSKFLASMSHDIRTPMNAIIGMCNLAIEEEADAEQVHESLQIIQQSSALLLSMITDILDMNRIESGKMILTSDSFSFSEQLNLAVGRARVLAAPKRQKVELAVNIVHDCCVGDVVRIHRVIDNILANALKFTPEDGTIHYTLSESAMENKNIGLYRFEIADTGIGISPEQQQHIFEPFYRAQNSMISQIEGAGLGLSIVKSIVDYMGGTISVHSVLGAGTTFVLELPLRFAAAAHPDKGLEQTPAHTVHLAGAHVLLCEDHPMNQLVATRILEKVGVLVTVANNGSIGYEAFAASKPGTFDAVLMDVQMPMLNGYEATQAIRECSHPQAKTIPVIAMTANAFAEDVQKSINAGMNDHLAKPIEPQQLYDTLAKFIELGAD